MSILKDISVISLLVVSTAGISGWYVQKSLQVNQVINEVNNQVKLNSAAAATLKTESVSREFVEIVVRDLTKNVEKAQVQAAVASVQAAKSEGQMQALAPVLSNPELQSTLKTLASSPEAVSALNSVATAVEKAKDEGDGGKTIELISRLDSIEANIKKIEDFHIDELAKKIDDLKNGTPSLEALDSAIKKTTDELISRGDTAIQKEVDKLSSKLSDQIISTNQPVNVRIGNAENSILSLNTKVDGHTLDIDALKIKDIDLNTDLLSQVSDLHSDIGGLSMNLNIIAKQVVPIGGVLCIADWLGATIESNFVRADGQVLADSTSPLNGKTMPDLNIAQLYLRGGATGGILQEASIPLLGTVVTGVTLDTSIDKARTDNDPLFDSYKNFVKTASVSFSTTPIRLGDALELRPKSLTCVQYIRVK